MVYMMMRGRREHFRPDPGPTQPDMAVTQIIAHDIEQEHHNGHTDHGGHFRLIPKNQKNTVAFTPFIVSRNKSNDKENPQILFSYDGYIVIYDMI